MGAAAQIYFPTVTDWTDFGFESECSMLIGISYHVLIMSALF